MVNVHGFQSQEDADVVSRNIRLLDKWRKENGYTNVAGQCRFCLKTVGKNKFRRHVDNCRISNTTGDAACIDNSRDESSIHETDTKPPEYDHTKSSRSNLKW